MPRASRSRPGSGTEPTPPHADRCCLRCAKRYAVDPTVICARSNRHVNCSRCRQLNKRCLLVPPSFLGRLRCLQEGAASQLAAAARAQRPGLSTSARVTSEVELKDRTITLALLQRTFTSRVEAYLRRAGNVSAEERRLAVETRIANALEHLVVAVHRHLHLEIPQLGEGEEDSEEEEGGDGGNPPASGPPDGE
ncbi:hypothetical protein FGG08_004991 [Glutinoglossum americanum]|uniref:Uncharacterized protein n=1 Tax=Glutinoglossum americanum TaxID=1670608 RepID=A0A9P8HZA3_9PEZI|nr:hypothetical protein FGG08_004991 [Glutinoglossum americanum]